MVDDPHVSHVVWQRMEILVPDLEPVAAASA